MKDIGNKERVLKVRDIFERETDNDNELSPKDIIKKLESVYGPDYTTGLRSIKSDINALINSGYNLIENIDDSGKKLYSRQEREFEVYQLRILIDAISTARFIDKEESSNIIKKIKKLTSDSKAQKLLNPVYIDSRVVCEDKNLRYYINELHHAVQERKKVKFRYGRYNIQKNFVETNPGSFYEVDPYGLVWNNGFYYLVGYNAKRSKIINYRVDRIRNLETTAQNSDKDYFELAEYIDQCFNMYHGKVRHIKIKFDNHLINAIIDRFGKDVNIKPYDKQNFILSTDAALTKGLVRWVLNWGADAEVLFPDTLIEEVQEEIRRMTHIYHL